MILTKRSTQTIIWTCLQCRLRPSSFWTILIKAKKSKSKISSRKGINFLMKMLTYNWNKTMMAAISALIMFVKKPSRNRPAKRRTTARGDLQEPWGVRCKEKSKRSVTMMCRSSVKLSNWRALWRLRSPMETDQCLLNNRTAHINWTGIVRVRRMEAPLSVRRGQGLSRRKMNL